MGIDDEKAKIRRNLVTFCAALLACFYLDISIYDLFVQFGLGKLQTTVSPGKLIAVSLAIFIYLFWRWATGAEQKEYLAKIVSTFMLKGEGLIFLWVADMAKNRKFGPNFDFIDEANREYFENWYKDKIAASNVPSELFISPRSSTDYKFKAQWVIHYYFQKPNGESTTPLNVHAKFAVPFGVRLKIRTLSMLHVMWQADFWEWAPPAIFSFLTVIVLFYKAVMSVLFATRPVGVLYCA